MKKLLSIVLLGFMLIASTNLISQITVTNNFQNLAVADGLVDNHVTDVFIENDSNVWIATIAGLSFYDGSSFSNYTTTNSGLNNDNIRELEYAQRKIWMITDSGISSFDGLSFINYTTTNGLISSNILGLAATSTDTLWMTSTTGSGKFDGTAFTNYPVQNGRDIETDSLDRVYVMRATVANAFPFARLYENGAWSMPTQSGINFGIGGAKLIKTASNRLYVTGFAANPTVFVRIDYPLNCTAQSVYLNNSPHTNAVNDKVNPQQFEELNGIRWMGAGNNVPFYVVSSDSNYINQYVSNSIAVSSCIKGKDNLLAIGSNVGIYLSKPTIKKTSIGNAQEFAVNNIRTSVTVTDPLFSNLSTGSANFEFPKDSNSHGIYSANFIVAAKKSNQTNYEVHPTSGFVAAFSPGPITTSGGLANAYMVRVTKQEIISHQSSFNQSAYVMPDGIKNWPAVGDTTIGIALDLAPFFDLNNNGCYDPQNGDYPIIKGDEALYWVNHPINQNIELEYHWMMYAFVDTSLTLDQTIFVDYTIVNRANVVYDSVKVGLFLDSDVGNASDDYVGCDSINDIMYSYNGSFFDLGQVGNRGYGKNTPALGVKFISDPMTSFTSFNTGNVPNGGPTTSQHWLSYMNAKWKNGQDLKYGGNGYNSAAVSNSPTTHMYTGDPFALTGWTELTPGSMSPANGSGDRRTLGSMPYFSLQPNERKTIEIAVGFGRTADTTSQIGQNVRELVRVLNGASTYTTGINLPALTFTTTDSCILITSIKELLSAQSEMSVFPVPSSGELTIETEENMLVVEVYDMKGAKVLSIPTRQNRIQLSLTEYRNGFYLVRVQLQDESWRMKKVIKM